MEITPFDQMVTDNFLQMIKIMIPYLPDGFKRTAGIYVKFNELINAFHCSSFTSSSTNESMFQELAPYLPEDIQQYMDMFEMMQNIDLGDIYNMFQMEGADISE